MLNIFPACFNVPFFFNGTAATEIYTLSLHDALPISISLSSSPSTCRTWCKGCPSGKISFTRSEEHTSELQSHSDLVCRLPLEKKKQPQQHIFVLLNQTKNQRTHGDSNYG